MAKRQIQKSKSCQLSEYEQISLRSQVWRHFKRNKSGICQCNHCGILIRQSNRSTTQLFSHLTKIHSQLIYGFDNPKKQEQDFMNDFIEDLVMYGYPIEKVIKNLSKLLVNYTSSFHKSLQHLTGDLPRARLSLEEKLESLPIDSDKDMAERLIMENYPNLSQGTRKHLLEQYFWIYSSEQEVILNFKDHGYNIISQHQKQNIIIMILVTQTMKNSYFQYGDCLSIDVIQKVFKKRSPHGFAEYSCWFFTGQNENLDNVIFGFAIVNQTTQQNFEFLFTTFFKQMDDIYPISICIPPYILLQKMLQKTAPTCNIIINWYHKLNFMKQVLQKQIEHENIMRSMCQCFQTPSKAQFDFHFSKIMSKVSDQDAILYGLKQNVSKFCIFQIGLKFIGFCIQASKFMELEKQVRQTFIYQRNLARLLIYVIKQDQKLNIKSQQQLNKRKAPVHNGSLKVSSRIEQRIKANLNEMRDCKMQVINPITVRLATRINHISRWKIFNLIFNIQGNHWTCNCRFLEHTGIPCAHLIKVIERFQGDYRYYISTRWLISQSY